MTDPLVNLITAYHELNPSIIEELTGQPSPLEFMRFVARNRPFVVRGGASDWDAVKRWDAAYLREAMKGQPVQVAITPLGNADAVVDIGDGSLVFVEPYEVVEEFGDFLDYVQEDSKAISNVNATRNVKYAQTQNDNLREEYKKLFEDVPREISFAQIALQNSADAINMWIGNQRSVTSMHKDNYENIYVQVRGQKHFVLISPVEMPCVNERALIQGRYVPKTYEDPNADLEIKVNGEELLPVPTWDPDDPDYHATGCSHLANPVCFTLREGDMLYLPAMWYHKVSQTVGEEGFACAVNYWYDMDFSGSFWSSNSFLRDATKAFGQCHDRDRH